MNWWLTLVVTFFLTGCGAWWGQDNYCDSGTFASNSISLSLVSWESEELQVTSTAKTVTTNQDYNEKTDTCNNYGSTTEDATDQAIPFTVHLCRRSQIETLESKSGKIIATNAFGTIGSARIFYQYLLEGESLVYCRLSTIPSSSSETSDISSQREACGNLLIQAKACQKL